LALAAGEDIETRAENTTSPWLRIEEPDPVKINVPVKAEEVVVTDMFGRNRKTITAVNGFVEIEATEFPQYVLEDSK
jgi:hypothetical protein